MLAKTQAVGASTWLRTSAAVLVTRTLSPGLAHGAAHLQGR
jgi:hypothetical protein